VKQTGLSKSVSARGAFAFEQSSADASWIIAEMNGH
jgi:hypothetical protein